VHLLRNSFRYAGRQHWDAIAKALKPVYTQGNVKVCDLGVKSGLCMLDVGFEHG
jgi:transposase-like protein